MPKHTVTFTIPERNLGKADVEFKIQRDGESLGRLKVSNGTLVWVPKNATYGYSMDWVKFHSMMQEHGRHERYS